METGSEHRTPFLSVDGGAQWGPGSLMWGVSNDDSVVLTTFVRELRGRGQGKQ